VPAQGDVAFLGNETKKLSGNAPQRLRERIRRSGRGQLQQLLWKISTLPRVAGCRRRRLKVGGDPTVRLQEGRAHFTGLQLCGSISACACCGPQIRQARAEEINHGLVELLTVVRHWGERSGDVGKRNVKALCCPIDERDRASTGTALLLTLTMPHDFGEALRELLETIRGGHAAVTSGRAWMQDKETFRLVGYIRAHDATDGQHGWHPHLHSVICIWGELTDVELTRLKRRLYVRWAHSIVGDREKLGARTEPKDGARRLPSYLHGIHLEKARSVEDVAKYAAAVAGDVDAPEPEKSVMVGARSRVGLELTRNDLKTGLVTRKGEQISRTPWEILRAIAAAPVADEDGVVNAQRELDIQRWHEWEREMHGVQAIRWSAGLKAMLGVLEREDEEIVAEEIGGETVHEFTAEEWRAVCGTKGAPTIVLERAEDAGGAGVRAYLAEIIPHYLARQARDREWERRHPELTNSGSPHAQGLHQLPR
jgi:hypothetical protein